MLIYMHTSKTSGKSYIGCTIKSMEGRLKEHISSANKGVSSHFCNAIRKYGIEDFISVVLEDNIEDYEFLNERERYWIEYYNTFESGYNSTTGGDNNTGFTRRNFSEDHKQKMSNRMKNSTYHLSHLKSFPGSANGRAKQINIYNSNDEIMFECHGNFKQICEYNNLPTSSLSNSYRNNGKKIMISQRKCDITRYTNDGRIIFKGWYAKIVEGCE